MRIPTSSRGAPPTINMTPMIDVTFLLIIFFLVSSHLGKQENHIPLELPLSQTGLDTGLSDLRSTTTIQVLADENILLGSTSIEASRLQPLIAARHRETPGGLRIRIRTDRTVPYRVIAKVLKACADAGVSDVVFAVYEGASR